MADIEFQGTGGIIEGDLEDANVNVNLDAALDFNGDGGTDDYVTLTEGSGAPTIAADGAFTISAWIKPAFTSGSKYVAGEGHSGGSSTDTDRFGIIVSGSTIAISMYINNGDDVSSYVTVDVDKWNHIAFTRAASSTTGRYYINGVAAGTDTVDNANWVLGKIGGYGNNSSNRWQGHIADVKLYNSDLSTDGADLTPIQALASKINIHYSQVGTGTQPLSWFKLNDGTGNPADSGSSGNATVRTNATWDLGGPTDDPFSVNVQKDGTTTDGNFTVTQGRVEGKALTSLLFDGSDDNVDAQDIDAGTSNLSIAGWFKLSSSNMGGSTGTLIAKGDNGGNRVWTVFYSAGNGVRFALSDDGSAFNDEVTSSGAITDTNWHHFVATYEPSTAIKIYIDGVLEGTNSSGISSSLRDTNDDLRMGTNSDTAVDFSGNLRDMRIYDYTKSAEQVASLYSNTCPQTPLHWWKLDDNLLAPAGSAYVQNFGTGTIPSEAVRNGATSSNGTLDLDGKLETAANGTFSAPRGKVQLAGNFEPAGTWIHNNGTLETNNTAEKDFNINASTALYNWTHDGSTMTIEDATDGHTIIENALTINSGAHLKPQDGADVTFGTSSQACTVTNNGTFENRNSNNTVTFKGASSLYPFAYEGTDFNWDGDASAGNVQNYILSNCNWNPDITTGAYVNIQLAGDCEFDAFTVSANSTLDLSGQRMFTSGLVTISGDNGLKNTTDGSTQDTVAHLITNGIIASTTTHHASLSNVVYIADGGSNQHKIEYFDFGTFVSTRDGNIDFGRYGPDSSSINVIAANGGNLSNWGRTGSVSNANSMNNFTIATGTTAVPESAELTVAGDFTTSGGLLGASCLELNGSDEYGYNSGTTWGFGDAWTVEMWFKTSTDALMYLFDLHNDSDNDNRIYLRLRDDSTLKFGTYDSSGTEHGLHVTGIDGDDGKWHHVAITSSGTVKQCYYDGKLQAQSTTTVDRDADPTMRLRLGRLHASASNYFNGCIDELRIWNTVRTQTEIRDNMFKSGYSNLSNNGGLMAAYDFDAGTGNEANNANTSSEVGARDLTLYDGSGAATDLWAGAGTFTRGTSNIKMTGSNKNINYLGHSNVYDFEVTGTVTLNEITGSALEWRLFGQNFTMGSGATLSSNNTEEFVFRSGFNGGTISLADPATNIANVYRVFCNGDGALSLPELTTKFIKLDRTGGNVTATGNITLTTELQVDSGTTFNANGNTISVKELDVNGGILDLRNSTLDFNQTASGDEFNLHSSSTLTTGNTTITGNTSSNTPAYLSYGGDFEVVGDVSNLELQSDSDLTVIGAVTNCTFQSDVTNANIRQWHHTLDTQQLLDADEIGDDDLRLTKPALDNAHELMTK